jgi:2-oxoisovalerate dehydrogenase E2 component (dihydrolipoyl transacylase)
VLAEVETAKATVELPSPRAGVVERLYVPEGTTVAVGAPLVAFRVDAAASTPEEPAPQPDLVGYGAAAAAGGGPVRRPRRFPRSPAPPQRAGVALASPPVRHLAAARGVRLDLLTGTGPDGVVSRADVERAASAAPPEDAERIPVHGVRRRTAAAMTASAAVPQATVFTTVDVTATLDLLERAKDDAGRAPTVLAAVARAVCLAVPATPDVNARWDGDEEEIVRFRPVHLGIAVATPRGLLVPVLRDAQASTLPTIAGRLRETADDARAGRTTPQALAGGTFTISNVGVFGVDAGTPMLHDGQSAILAVGAVARRPWEWRGEVALRSTVVLALTFDHRVLDGEGASRFLVDVGHVLTDPATAFLR